MSHESVGLVAICLGAYLGAFVQSFVVDLDCGRGRSEILTTTYQIKVQSVNFMEFCDRKGYIHRYSEFAICIRDSLRFAPNYIYGHKCTYIIL